MQVKGWEKAKAESLLHPGIVEVTYRKEKQSGPPWVVVADYSGVVIRGESHKIQENSHLDDFAWIVGDAMREYLKLKKARDQKFEMRLV